MRTLRSSGSSVTAVSDGGPGRSPTPPTPDLFKSEKRSECLSGMKPLLVWSPI